MEGGWGGEGGGGDMGLRPLDLGEGRVGVGEGVEEGLGERGVGGKAGGVNKMDTEGK